MISGNPVFKTPGRYVSTTTTTTKETLFSLFKFFKLFKDDAFQVKGLLA